MALTNRPEIASRQALVEAAAISDTTRSAAVHSDCVLNGYQSPGGMLLQAGIFGFGQNGSLNQWRGREDVSIQFIWQLENFGLGNLARIKEQRAESRASSISDALRTGGGGGHGRSCACSRRRCGCTRPNAPAHRPHHVQRDDRGPETNEPFRRRHAVLISRPQEAVYALQMLQTRLTNTSRR